MGILLLMLRTKKARYLAYILGASIAVGLMGLGIIPTKIEGNPFAPTPITEPTRFRPPLPLSTRVSPPKFRKTYYVLRGERGN